MPIFLDTVLDLGAHLEASTCLLPQQQNLAAAQPVAVDHEALLPAMQPIVPGELWGS